MSWFPRHLAPAGAPIGALDLARWAATAVAGGDVAGRLEQMARDRFGVRHACLTATGRAGMTVLLRAMRRVAGGRRDEVILPSYTCFSVAASVVKAGLTPRIVDIDPATLDYDREQIERADCSRVLAIVATNLYGLPNDLPFLSALARRQGAFLIDDAAQAMGATVGGRASGTWGDAGLYSFDKGKNVSAIDGGIIVTGSDELAAAIRHEIAAFPSVGAVHAAVDVAKALVYAALLRPWLYWIPNAIPQLELGKTVYTTDIAFHAPSRPLVALAVTMLRRLDAFNSGRVANAARLIEGLAGMPGVRVPAPVAGAAPVYVRLPVLVEAADRRDQALVALQRAGIGASGSYPASLADVAELQAVATGALAEASGGRHVARHIVTLPTHRFVRRRDMATMVATLAGAGAGHHWRTARQTT